MSSQPKSFNRRLKGKGPVLIQKSVQPVVWPNLTFPTLDDSLIDLYVRANSVRRNGENLGDVVERHATVYERAEEVIIHLLTHVGVQLDEQRCECSHRTMRLSWNVWPVKTKPFIVTLRADGYNKASGTSRKGDRPSCGT